MLFLDLFFSAFLDVTKHGAFRFDLFFQFSETQDQNLRFIGLSLSEAHSLHCIYVASSSVNSGKKARA